MHRAQGDPVGICGAPTNRLVEELLVVGGNDRLLNITPCGGQEWNKARCVRGKPSARMAGIIRGMEFLFYLIPSAMAQLCIVQLFPNAFLLLAQ